MASTTWAPLLKQSFPAIPRLSLAFHFWRVGHRYLRSIHEQWIVKGRSGLIFWLGFLRIQQVISAFILCFFCIYILITKTCFFHNNMKYTSRGSFRWPGGGNLVKIWGCSNGAIICVVCVCVNSIEYLLLVLSLTRTYRILPIPHFHCHSVDLS